MKWHKLTNFGALFSITAISFLTLAVSQPTWSQQTTVNLSTTITGNQEQPRVAYIVPWQPVNDSELENTTIQSQLNMVFGHVEKIELQRELSFMKELTQTTKIDKK